MCLSFRLVRLVPCASLRLPSPPRPQSNSVSQSGGSAGVRPAVSFVGFWWNSVVNVLVFVSSTNIPFL